MGVLPEKEREDDGRRVGFLGKMKRALKRRSCVWEEEKGVEGGGNVFGFGKNG